GVFVSANSAGLNEPEDLVFGPDGNLYVASSNTFQVLRYDGTTGAPVGSGVFVPAGSAGLNNPTFLVFTPPPPPPAVPEPSSRALPGRGLAAGAGCAWQRRRAA